MSEDVKDTHALMGDPEHEIEPMILRLDNGQDVTLCKACGLRA